MNKSITLILVFGLLISAILMTGCGTDSTSTPEPEQVKKEIEEPVAEVEDVEPVEEEVEVEEPEPTKVPSTNTPVPPTETPIPTPDLPPLPPERQYVTFQTEDGLTLEGYFYPSKYHNADVVVMMHWAPGTQEDWPPLALWLQNRADEYAFDSKVARAIEGVPPWFPALNPSVSLSVLTFNFRGYGGSDGPQGWDLMHLDAKAAVKFASTLEGVDPNRISTIGASIGADGAVDGCQLFNEFHPNDGLCLGALSLSPGSYIGMDYADTVRKLMEEDPPKPVFCFSAQDDPDSWETCQNAEGEAYTPVDYAAGGHGMDLIKEGIEPDTMMKIIEFLELVYGYPFLAE